MREAALSRRDPPRPGGAREGAGTRPLLPATAPSPGSCRAGMLGAVRRAQCAGPGPHRCGCVRGLCGACGAAGGARPAERRARGEPGVGSVCWGVKGSVSPRDGKTRTSGWREVAAILSLANSNLSPSSFSPLSCPYFRPAIMNLLRCLKPFHMSFKSPRQSPCPGGLRAAPHPSRSWSWDPAGHAAAPGPRQGRDSPQLQGCHPFSQPGSAARPRSPALLFPTSEPGAGRTHGAGAGGRRQQRDRDPALPGGGPR